MKEKLQKHIKSLIIIVLVFLFILLTINYFNILKSSYENSAKWLYPDNPNRNGELLKISLSFIGGLGILYGLYISLKRVKAMENGVEKQGEAIKKQSEQIELSRKAQTDERFKNAVEHLGSEKEPIILGGIAELQQIAKENRIDYSEIIFNILCSYIRTTSKNKVKKNISIIQTIVDFLFSNNPKNPFEGLSANLSYSNLEGIVFNNSNLKNANLYHTRLSDFSNSDLTNANIERAIFFLSKITNVVLTNTNLNSAVFYSATIKDCILDIKDNYQSLSFIDSSILKTKIENINISDWNFINCIMSNVSFNNSDVLYSKFTASIMQDVSFIDNKLFNENDFRAVNFSSVKMYNLYIIRNYFNSSTSKDNPTRFKPFTKGFINHEGVKTDLSGIEMKETIMIKCTDSFLTKKDIETIVDNYKEFEKTIFNK